MKDVEGGKPALHSEFKHGYPSHWEHRQSRHLLGFHDPTHVEFYDPHHDLILHWSSRRHRKGLPPKAHPLHPSASKEARWTVKHRFPRLIGFDWKDISWHVAMLFTVGSLWWCANGVMSFNFFYNDSDGIAEAEAATAFLGGSWFLVGAYLGFVESLNPSRDTDFGYEVDAEAHSLMKRNDTSNGSLGKSRNHFGQHHPLNRHSSQSQRKSLDENEKSTHDGKLLPAWRWWGSDWHSLGFVANAVQLFGAIVFWISVLCGLPGVLPTSGASEASGIPTASLWLWEVLFWAMQILGAPCFVFAGALFCIECQKRWYLPTVTDVGWQIGAWNVLGGVGFWLCGIFGTLRETGGSEGVQKWGTAFSTYWGSWAFLIGSYLQLYETLNK